MDKDEKSLPFVFINGEVVSVGKFLTYEEFAALLKEHMEQG